MSIQLAQPNQLYPHPSKPYNTPAVFAQEDFSYQVNSDTAYDVSPLALQHAAAKIAARRTMLEAEKHRIAREKIEAAADGCFQRQEAVARRRDAKRRAQEGELRREWGDHFKAQRGKRFEALKLEAGYEEEDLEVDRAWLF